MITYYAYSVEYGQYLTDTVTLNHAAKLNLHGLPYGQTDVHTFISRSTGLVSSGTFTRASMMLELWQKKFSWYGLHLEKISPIKEKIIEGTKEKIIIISRGVLVDDSEDVTMIHFEKKELGELD